MKLYKSQAHDFESYTSANSATPAFCTRTATGFEPVNKGFADLGLTTWLCRQETGLAGFEPTNDGVKVRCLTAWL